MMTDISLPSTDHFVAEIGNSFAVCGVFGNPADAEVGYARGNLLRSSVEEALRLRHCQQLVVEQLQSPG